MHRFFVDHTIKGDHVEIHDREQLQQLKKVLRLSKGDRIVLLDNTGYEYDSEIISLDLKKMEAQVLDKREGIGFSQSVTLYMALLKKDNFEHVLQKATELGVSKVVPILTDRCVKTSISDNQYERYQKIIHEATEQSEGAILPQLEKLQDFTVAIDNLNENTLNLIALARNGDAHLNELDTSNDITLFIGPEGGFTDFESEYALQKGCIPLSLGRRILRAETAAVASLGRILLP